MPTNMRSTKGYRGVRASSHQRMGFAAPERTGAELASREGGEGAFMILLALALPVSAGAASDALAEVDGVAITAEEVEKAVGAPLARLQEQIYTRKRQKVE